MPTISPRAEFELEVVQPALALRRIRRIEPAHAECKRARGRIVRGDRRRIGADHQACQARLALAARIDDRDQPPGAQHGAALSQAADLIELVTDEKDTDAIGRKPLERAEQPHDRLWFQHRSRLVEDQQPRRRHQRTQDLDPLPLADRKIVHPLFRIDFEVVALRQGAHARGQPPERLRRKPQRHVFCQRQRLEQHEMLKHHRDAESPSARRASDLDLAPIDRDPSGVRAHDAVDNLHQRALAGAVFAEHRHDLARHHVERDRVIGDGLAETLGDLLQRQSSRHRWCQGIWRKRCLSRPAWAKAPLTTTRLTHRSIHQLCAADWRTTLRWTFAPFECGRRMIQAAPKRPTSCPSRITSTFSISNFAKSVVVDWLIVGQYRPSLSSLARSTVTRT